MHVRDLSELAVMTVRSACSRELRRGHKAILAISRSCATPQVDPASSMGIGADRVGNSLQVMKVGHWDDRWRPLPGSCTNARTMNAGHRSTRCGRPGSSARCAGTSFPRRRPLSNALDLPSSSGISMDCHSESLTPSDHRSSVAGVSQTVRSTMLECRDLPQ